MLTIESAIKTILLLTASRVSNQYSDDRYNRTRLRRTYILPEVGGDFRR